MNKLCLVLAVCMIFGAVADSGARGVGTTGVQFLKIDPAARSLGMGGAYAAVVGDANAIFYNPAGIADLESKEIAGTYLQYFQSINYGSLAGVMPLEDSVVGVGINYLGVSDIDKRGTSDIDDPDGTASVDSFGAMDTAISVAYAKKDAFPGILEGLNIGSNLRFVYQTIDEESAFTLMTDVGGYYPFGEKLSVALCFQNIGMGVKYKDESDPLPMNIKAGVAYRPINGLTIACDLNEYIVDDMFYASAGAEYWLFDIVAFRAGYKYGYDTDNLGSNVGIAGGLGVRYMDLGLDYTFAPFGELGDTHRVSTSARF